MPSYEIDASPDKGVEDDYVIDELLTSLPYDPFMYLYTRDLSGLEFGLHGARTGCGCLVLTMD